MKNLSHKCITACLAILSTVGFIQTSTAAPAQAQMASHTDRLRHLLSDLNRSSSTASNKVTLILETADLNDSISQQVTSHGGKFRYHSGQRHEIQIAANKLKQLINRLPANTHLRLPYPHQALSVTSQGVGITGASDMQALGNGGQGIKVGIIDLGFSSYTTAQASGDLPANLSLIDYTGSGTGGTNHGTNVAEIVHDMAPNAELYLAKVSTTLQLEQAMNDMLAAGVKIINHSVAWFGAAFYDGTGPICEITDSAEAGGIQWVNAMGNSRITHYLGTFSDTDGNLRHEFASGQNSNTMNLTAGYSYSLILNWDAYPTTSIDYNLYIYNGDPDAGATIVSSSTNRQNGNFNSSPYESVTFTANTTGTYHIVITKGSGDSDVPLTLFTTGPSLITRTSVTSIVQPADCYSVLSVGAVNLDDGFESFSSEGPTTDGRIKPDIAAPNRTQTSLSTSFTGTSGASPHAAGAAALLLSQHPEYTPAELRARLIANAQDVLAIGYDNRSGYGRISMDADEDGFNHDVDNCTLLSNIDQLDTDLDIQGNVCDEDDDNDGLSDTLELSIGTDELLVDTDGDGLSDYLEVSFDGDATSYSPGADLNPLLIDSDGDTLDDYAELAWDGDATSYSPASDLNPLSMDSDGDSFSDASDPIPLDFNYADGDIAPLGAPDGLVNVADYVIYQRIMQQNLTPTIIESSHGDIYPPGAPDGIIDLSDFLQLKNLLLR